MDGHELSGRMLGDFRLLETIDEGGYATVFLAEQWQIGRRVVVKILHARLQSRDVAVARFTREAQLAARFDHPYASHLYAFGVEPDGLLWIAMELVHGVTLHDWLAAHGPMALEQLVPFLDRVAEVVSAAHDRGIVHRDLKPANIMVLDDAGVLTPKLLDFGIAKIIDEASQPPVVQIDDAVPVGHLTDVDSALGSPPYMAPEQWDDPVGVRAPSDLYALGVVAYEALTGRHPFTARTLSEYAELHRTAPVPPLGAGFATTLDRVFARALAKRATDRFRGALDFAAALRAALRTREHLALASRQWQDRGRPSSLLWRSAELADLERWTRSTATIALGDPEAPFVAASRSARRLRAAMRGSAVVIAVTAVLGAIAYRSAMQANTAEQIAEISITTAEVEQGRQALLHDDSAEARLHLGEAYRRGERSPATAFMLARATQPKLAEQSVFAASRGRMWSAAWAPDGRRLVTTDDAAAQIWDAATQRRIATLPHGDTVYAATWTLAGDRLITASGDGTVQIWDATGALIHTMSTPGRRWFRLAVSRELIAAMDASGTVAQVWSTADGTQIAALPNDGTEFPVLAFSSDGRWLATTGGDEVHVWDTATWKRAAAIGARHVHAFAFAPGGARLLTGGADGDASIWAVPSGARVRHLREVGDPVDAVAYAPSGDLIAVAVRDGAVQVMDSDTGVPRSKSDWRHGRVQALEIDPGSALLLTAGTDGTVIVSDLAQGIAVAELQGSTGVVAAAHWDPSGHRIVGASWDGTARVWDASAPYRRWAAPPVAVDCGIVTGAEPDRRFIAVGCRAQPTRVWDTDRDELLAELPAVTRVDGDFLSAWPAVSAAGDRAAIAQGNEVVVYELPGGRELRRIEHGAAVNAVAFAPVGRALVSGAVDGSVTVTADGAAPIALPSASAGIDTVVILVDGRMVTTDARGVLRVYRGGAIAAKLELPSRVMALRPSLDGHRLVTIPTKRSAAAPVLVDLESYRLAATLTGHVGRVFAARWVGGAVLTAGADGAVRAWDGVTGRAGQVYGGGPRAMTDAVLSLDGTMLLAGGVDGVLRFWDARTARPLWTLTAHKSYIVGIRWAGRTIVSRGFGGELSRWALPGR